MSWSSPIASVSIANNGTTGAIDTTGADFLVAVVSQGFQVDPPTDNKSNTWTALTEQTGSSSNHVRIYYAKNATCGTGHTFTTPAGAAFPSLCVVAFFGSDLTSPFDNENGVGESSSPVSTGSITPSQNDELVIAIAGGNCTSPAIDGGFTLQENEDQTGGVNYGSAIAWLIQTTAAAANPAWTVASSCNAAIASFKAAAGGGGVNVAEIYHNLMA